MVRPQGKRFILERETAIGQSSHRRRPTKLSPGCETLDDRQLLSTAAAATELLVPPAASVRMAATFLENHAAHRVRTIPDPPGGG